MRSEGEKKRAERNNNEQQTKGKETEGRSHRVIFYWQNKNKINRGVMKHKSDRVVFYQQNIIK